MLDSNTKRHIDNARDILVGVVPNPSSQIDQITNALIYKFMDDMDQASIKAGGEPSFFVGDLEKYSWVNLMSERMGNQERMNLYTEALAKFGTAKQLPSLFRDIFKTAFLPYRSPEVLGLFLKEINYFDYSHSEELGNAYEYLLQIMGSQGDAGQFRTPRNIIDFIVAVVNPDKGDKVLDPACGTAGFLISAYKHIIAHHDGENGKRITPDERKRLFDNFEGYDIDPGMVRIAQVNMYLHEFRNPKIVQYDSLSQEERWSDKFDVIFANPPFMSPRGGIRPNNKFSITSTRSEVLFVDYIMQHLKPKGRAGIIVPEGVIFKSDTAAKQLRKQLVEDGLYAVVSLPSGVFNPYAGVKTSILLFDNARAKETDELLFVKIENDGFDLGAQRRPITRNDLPEALEVLATWRNGEKKESRLAQWVSREKIAESGSYNLSSGIYFDHVAGTSHWPLIALGELCQLQRGMTYSSKQLGDESTGTPFYNLKSIKRDGGKDDDFKFFIGDIKDHHFASKDDVLVALTDLTPTSELIGSPKLVSDNQHAAYSADLAKVVFTSATLNHSFLYYLLRSEIYRRHIVSFSHGANVKHLQSDGFYKFQIPLPPLEIQQQIVAELDGYQKIIDGARQIVENWKPQIHIDPKWDRKKVRDIAVVQNGYAFKSELFNDDNKGVPIARIRDVNSGFTNTHYSGEYADEFVIDSGDLLIGMDGDFRVGLWSHGIAVLNQRVCRLMKFNGVKKNYLYYLLQDELNKIHSVTYAVTVKHLSSKQVEDIVIPLPALDVQQQIVDAIEAERTHVESARALIDIYTQKTKDTIAKLWGDGIA